MKFLLFTFSEQTQPLTLNQPACQLYSILLGTVAAVHGLSSDVAVGQHEEHPKTDLRVLGQIGFNNFLES